MRLRAKPEYSSSVRLCAKLNVPRKTNIMCNIGQANPKCFGTSWALKSIVKCRKVGRVHGKETACAELAKSTASTRSKTIKPMDEEYIEYRVSVFVTAVAATSASPRRPTRMNKTWPSC